MSLRGFFLYVEVQTKVASVVPFLLGTVYAVYRYGEFRLWNCIIMFISLICFDMATTAINNYCDYKAAKNTKGYNYETKNAMVRYNIKESTALAIIFTLLVIAVIFGIVLTIRTGILILLIGGVSFVIGILYTFGPVPISRMPLGELFSGVFMGFVIMFLSIYVHSYDQNIAALIFRGNILTLNINIIEVIYILLMSVPAMGGIANIMLANNICDVDEDIINKRYTLPYYIGKKNALILFRTLYFIGYIAIIIQLILNIAPVISAISLLTFIPVIKNIRMFCDKPAKGETFVLSVKNFVLMNTVQILLIGTSLALGW